MRTKTPQTYLSVITINLTLKGSKANCRKVARNISQAVADGLEQAAGASFTGQGNVEVVWTSTQGKSLTKI